MIKDNVGKFNECFGCSVCSLSCPQNIIEIKERDGFLRPVITDAEKCTQCRMCLRTCSFQNIEDLNFLDKPISYYSAHSKNVDILRSTTSGGIVYELFRHAVSDGYEVLAVKFDKNDNRPVYYKASNLDELEKSKGSKYLQADFSFVKKDIDWTKKYFVIGTPCAIASLKRLIQLKRKKDNFVLLDFFCHGVPSFKLWDEYLKMRGVTSDKVDKVTFRPKDYGWHQSLRVKLQEGEKTYVTQPPKEDAFFKFFLGDRCLQKSCYDDCAFKQLNSSADIRVGDLWGKKYLNEESGISGVVALSEKGDEMIRKCQRIVIKEEHPETVLSGQMKKNAKRAKSYRLAQFGLNQHIPLRYLWAFCNLIDNACFLPKRILNKLKRI